MLNTVILFTLRVVSAVIAKEGVFLKKQYYDKTCLFWSLYCKFFLATCWIGGFLFGCFIWLHSDPCSLNCFNCSMAKDFDFLHSVLNTEILTLGVGFMILSFFGVIVSAAYFFLRTALFAFSILKLQVFSSQMAWETLLLFQCVFLSLEFWIFSKSVFRKLCL